MAEQRFGDVLRELLEDKLGPRTAVRLASQLQVDASLVRRWLRHERVPGLESHYLAWIGEALNLGPEEFERLRRAQITTLSDPSLRPLSSAARNQQVRRVLAFESTRRRRPPRQPGLDFGMQEIYRGHGAMVRAFQAAVDRLPTPPPPEHEVLISLASRFRGPRSENDPRLDTEWVQALLRLLEKGWDCTFLTTPETPEESQNIAQRLIDVVTAGPGRFVSYNFRTEQPPPGVNDKIVFPDFALVGLRDPDGVGIDGVLVVRPAEQVRLLREHFHQLRRDATQGIAVYLPDDIELVSGIAEVEQLPGDRLVVKDGLSVVTTPPDWLTGDKLWAGAHVLSRAEYGRLVVVNRQRVADFERRVQNEQWFDFSSKVAIEELAQSGRFRDADVQQMVTLEPEDRIHFLEHLIGLLERYPNYHLALAGHNEMHLFSPAGWMVKGDESVVLRRRLDNLHFTSVIVRNRTIGEAFRDYFQRELWEGILPRHRDRDWVIDFIGEKVRGLRG